MTLVLVGLALVGAYLAAYGRFVWDGVLLLGLSAVGFLAVFLRGRLRAHGASPLLRQLAPAKPGGQIRAAALVGALVVALVTPDLPSGTDFTFWLLLWLAAVSAFVLSWLVPLLPETRFRVSMPREEMLALAALLLVALLLRGVGVGHIPANLGGDEGTQLRAALDLTRGPLGNPFATGWYSVPTMSFLAYGLVMRVLGATMAGGRWLSVLVGTVTVLTTFLLGRSLGGKRVAWVAAILVACSAYGIHFSRLASNQVFDPLVGTLSMWLVWQGLYAERPSRARAGWALSGLVAGLGWYGYFGARWVTVLVGLFVVWRLVEEPQGLRRHAPGIAGFIVGWLVAVLPLLGWYAAHPSPFSERYNAVSVFASGWMAREMELTGRSVWSLLGQQAWRSFTAFHLTPDPTFWYRPEAPLADFATGAALLIGLAAVASRARWPSRGLVLLWFVSTTTMAWVLTENPPSSQRGLLLLPAVALISAWGMEAVWALLARSRQAVLAVGVLVASIVVVFNVGFYFSVYTPRRIYGNPTAEAATELAFYLREHPHPACEGAARACSPPVYFFGPPFQYWGSGVFAFLVPEITGVNVEPDESPETVSSPARYVFASERADELDPFIAAHPGGVVSRVAAADGRTLAMIYDF